MGWDAGGIPDNSRSPPEDQKPYNKHRFYKIITLSGNPSILLMDKTDSREVTV